MKPRYTTRLFSTADEADTGAAGTATPAAPEAPAAPAAAATAEEKPNIIQLAMAAASSKATLIRRAEEADRLAAERQSTNDSLTAKITDLTTARDAALTDLAAARAELAQVHAALTTAQDEQTTAERAAVDIVAGLGVAVEDLPEQTASGDSIADIEAQLAATTDPRERYQLAEKLNTALGLYN